jgi:agmatinase
MSQGADPGAFGALPEVFSRYDAASIAILPVPYDGTSTWMKGAYRGPQALLDASAKMELFDIETETEVYRRGITTMDPVVCPDDPEGMVAAAYEAATPILRANKFLVGIGGEHSISVGLVRAAAEAFRDLSVLQFDAHADTRDEYEGSRYNHACVMSRIREMCPYVQVGIRSMDSTERERLQTGRTFFAHQIIGGQDIASKVTDALSTNVYLTIDLDVFDPSIMPSTGTPEPGGLGWYTVLELIQRVATEKNIVAMDVTELLPNPTNRAPDFFAAKLVYRVLSMVFLKK